MKKTLSSEKWSACQVNVKEVPQPCPSSQRIAYLQVTIRAPSMSSSFMTCHTSVDHNVMLPFQVSWLPGCPAKFCLHVFLVFFMFLVIDVLTGEGGRKSAVCLISHDSKAKRCAVAGSFPAVAVVDLNTFTVSCSLSLLSFLGMKNLRASCTIFLIMCF